MGCTHPKIRIELPEKYKNMQGGWSYKAKFEWIDKKEKMSQIEKFYRTQQLEGKIRKWDIIPCQKCLACYLENSRDKAVQLSLEEKNPEWSENEKWFITLTYDDQNLWYHEVLNENTGEIYTGASVYLKDLQDWIKRLRWNHPEKKIKYMAAREYGKKTLRPHYHIIIFGLPLNEELFIKIGNNAQGDPLWTTPQLDNIKSPDCWSIRSPRDKKDAPLVRAGNVQIGKVTFQSIAYVARYTMKKANKDINTDWWYAAQGLIREGISQSDNLGHWYYDLNRDRIYEFDQVPIMDNKGNFQKPPKSFDRRYKKEFPKDYKKVVKRRKELIRYNLFSQEQITDMTYNEILLAKEQERKRFKDLRGDPI